MELASKAKHISRILLPIIYVFFLSSAFKCLVVSEWDAVLFIYYISG